MRAGAAEFLYPPFEPGFEGVMRSVVTAPRTQPDAPATGKAIAFASVKGGCGATTLACHSAAWLRASAKKEVLLADLDVSAGIAGSLMEGAGRYTLDDALQNLHRLDLEALESAGYGCTLRSRCDARAAGAAGRRPDLPQNRLRCCGSGARNTNSRSSTSAAASRPCFSTCCSSVDTLALVATNEIPALRQARHMIQSLAGRGFGANRVKLVINRMPKRPPIELPELEEDHGAAHPCRASERLPGAERSMLRIRG